MPNPHVYISIPMFIARQLSPLKSPPVLGLLKSQSLCVLPGAGGAWRNADSTVRGECLNRSLTMSNCSLREAVCTGHDSADSTGAGSHNSFCTSEEGIAVGNFFFFFFKCFAVLLNESLPGVGVSSYINHFYHKLEQALQKLCCSVYNL